MYSSHCQILEPSYSNPIKYNKAKQVRRVTWVQVEGEKLGKSHIITSSLLLKCLQNGPMIILKPSLHT